METKEFKIQVPEGYEIDTENSTFKCIKFKPIKKDITYKDVCKNIFNEDVAYYIDRYGEIQYGYIGSSICDKDNTTTRIQLEKLLALNQLLNIAEYYNKLHPNNANKGNCYMIEYDKMKQTYHTSMTPAFYTYRIEACFYNKEDAQAVIDNPNFREILDTIYKD